MSSSRLFLAIPIPEHIRNEIADKTTMLRNIEGVRAVPPENYHVTVFFFGSVDDEKISSLINDIQKQLLGHAPFSLQTDTLSVFPKRHSRIIWLSFIPKYEFTELSRAIYPIARTYSQQDEEGKDQIAHVTCARIKSRKAEIPQLPSIKQHVIPVTFIELWKSVSEKDGVRYQPIYRFTLY